MSKLVTWLNSVGILDQKAKNKSKMGRKTSKFSCFDLILPLKFGRRQNLAIWLDLTLKSNQVTEIGAFMVRTKLASEFEFPAPILQGSTAGTENKFKNFCLFTTL